MLVRKNRLTGNDNFKKVQKEGRVYQSENFGVAILARGDSEPSRYAFIVSTKISKEAADRNRFKRAMSEGVRLNSIDLANGFDAVFLAKTTIAKHPTSEIMKEVKKALKEAGLFR